MFIYADVLPFQKVKNSFSSRHMLWGVLMLVIAASLVACGSKDSKKAGQSLARVNGEDITILQLNDELNHAGVQPGQMEAASKQLLDSLIDRQLILSEAMSNKIDRSPGVVAAIERAKADIIVKAYLQNIAAKITRPGTAEINDYYQKHPELFANRKEFELYQLAIANKDFSKELESFIDSTKSLDEVAEWLDKHGVIYGRVHIVRSSMDLPQQVVESLTKMEKGQLFIVGEKDTKVINKLVAVVDAPVSAANAAPMIEQFLTNKKTKDAVDVELANLRSRAKIEYLNASAPVAAPTQSTAPDNKAAGPK